MNSRPGSSRLHKKTSKNSPPSKKKCLSDEQVSDLFDVPLSSDEDFDLSSETDLGEGDSGDEDGVIDVVIEQKFIVQDDISNLAEKNIEDDVILTDSALPSPSSAVFKSPATKGMKRKNVIEDCMMDAYKIMKNVVEKPQKDDYSLYAELLARKLRIFDESTREILMHEIDEFIFRTKCETRNRTVQWHLPPMRLGHQYLPSYNNYAIPPYNHNISLSPLHSNMIHSINMTPAVSSFSPHSSENSRISQPFSNLNPSNSSQSRNLFYSY
ncbi:hypothetical protein QTP88_000797 [Uroleucon formosanum]